MAHAIDENAAEREEHLRLVRRDKERTRVCSKRVRNGSFEGHTEDEKVFFDFERDFDAYPPTSPRCAGFTLREGDAIERADAEVAPVSLTYLRTHRHFVREFYNISVWPKHVLIRYTWHTQLAVDEDAFARRRFRHAGWPAGVTASATLMAGRRALVDALCAEEDRKRRRACRERTYLQIVSGNRSRR